MPYVALFHRVGDLPWETAGRQLSPPEAETKLDFEILMADPISEYLKWKQQGAALRADAKLAIENRFRELLLEAARLDQEYRADFGQGLKAPASITTFRYKASAKTSQKATAKKRAGTKTPVAAPAPKNTRAETDPQIVALRKRLEKAQAKVDAAKAASKPTRHLEDQVYELEDALRLALQPQ